jgi:hypothetical protein
MASLFDGRKTQAQISNMYTGERAAIKKAAAVLVEKGLQRDFANILADHLIPNVIVARRSAVAKSAPSLDLGVAKTVESMVYDFELVISQMDKTDELENLLKSIVLKQQQAEYDL